MSNKIKIRLFFWTTLIIIVFWFLYMGIVPSGRIVYVNDYSKESEFVQKFSPVERVVTRDLGVQKIIANPVYFSLHTPRPFDEAKISIRYKNDFSLPLIEIGALVDKTVWRHNLKPFENSFLDGLEKKWVVDKTDDYSFYQKDKKFFDLNSFFQALPGFDKVAVYNYDFQADYRLEDYASSTILKTLDNFHSLQGAWQAYTYIDNEDMNMEFDFFDQNKNDDEDQVDIFLYYKNQLIHSIHLDDNDADREGGYFGEKLRIPSLPVGVYKIELKANSDIITKNIESQQIKFAFLNKVELNYEEEGELEVYTDSKEVSVTTIYPDRLGWLQLGSSTLAVDETYRQYSGSIKKASSSDKADRLVLRDGFIVGGSGVFSFSKEAYFNPKIKKAVSPFVSEKEIEFVIANYDPPRIDGEWKTQTQIIDLKAAYREKGKYSFLISIPDLGKRAEGEYVEIDEIRVELTGRSLMEKIKSYLRE